MAQATAGQSPQSIQSVGRAWVYDLVAVASATLLMAVCAHITIPLWFTPVPITLQTFGVMLLAFTLGSRRAFAALVLYLLEGIAGLPVFNPHGPGGLAQLLGPTGGYLMAYPFAAFLAGMTSERLSNRARLAAWTIAALAADLLIFTAGLTWLLVLTRQPMAAALKAGVLPFLPGEVLKVAAAMVIAARLRRFTR